MRNVNQQMGQSYMTNCWETYYQQCGKTKNNNGWLKAKAQLLTKDDYPINMESNYPTPDGLFLTNYVTS